MTNWSHTVLMLLPVTYSLPCSHMFICSNCSQNPLSGWSYCATFTRASFLSISTTSSPQRTCLQLCQNTACLDQAASMEMIQSSSFIVLEHQWICNWALLLYCPFHLSLWVLPWPTDPACIPWTACKAGADWWIHPWLLIDFWHWSEWESFQLQVLLSHVFFHQVKEVFGSWNGHAGHGDGCACWIEPFLIGLLSEPYLHLLPLDCQWREGIQSMGMCYLNSL